MDGVADRQVPRPKLRWIHAGRKLLRSENLPLKLFMGGCNRSTLPSRHGKETVDRRLCCRLASSGNGAGVKWGSFFLRRVDECVTAAVSCHREPGTGIDRTCVYIKRTAIGAPTTAWNNRAAAASVAW